MSQALCPNCEKMTPVGNSPKLGENVVCKFCGVESVIVWLNPIELDLPYDDNFEDEDYVYEDDGYYDDDEDDDYEDYP